MVCTLQFLVERIIFLVFNKLIYQSPVVILQSPNLSSIGFIQSKILVQSAETGLTLVLKKAGKIHERCVLTRVEKNLLRVSRSRPFQTQLKNLA